MAPSTSKSSASKGKAPQQQPQASSSSASASGGGSVLSPAQLEEKLANIRASKLYVLIKYGLLYLPDDDLVEKYTTWGRDSVGDVVVFKDIDGAKAEYTSATCDGPGAGSVEEDDEDGQPPVDGDPVTFHILTTVDKAGSQLNPDANWQGTQNSSLPDPPKFDKLSLKVRLGALTRQFAIFNAEHASAVNNVRKLLAMRAKSEYTTAPTPDGFFNLQHRLFSKLPRSSTDGSLVPPDLAGLPSFYDIEQYPFHTPESIKDAKKIAHDHQVVPLPAYENDTIINPNAYEDSIGGSLVHVSLRLRHYLIRKQSVFSYELVELNVVSRAAEGTKRKVGTNSASPMKKLRIF